MARPSAIGRTTRNRAGCATLGSQNINRCRQINVVPAAPQLCSRHVPTYARIFCRRTCRPLAQHSRHPLRIPDSFELFNWNLDDDGLGRLSAIRAMIGFVSQAVCFGATEVAFRETNSCRDNGGSQPGTSHIRRRWKGKPHIRTSATGCSFDEEVGDDEEAGSISTLDLLTAIDGGLSNFCSPPVNARCRHSGSSLAILGLLKPLDSLHAAFPVQQGRPSPPIFQSMIVSRETKLVAMPSKSRLEVSLLERDACGGPSQTAGGSLNLLRRNFHAFGIHCMPFSTPSVRLFSGLSRCTERIKSNTFPGSS